jgi:hypothetical protein
MERIMALARQIMARRTERDASWAEMQSLDNNRLAGSRAWQDAAGDACARHLEAIRQIDRLSAEIVGEAYGLVAAKELQAVQTADEKGENDHADSQREPLDLGECHAAEDTVRERSVHACAG